MYSSTRNTCVFLPTELSEVRSLCSLLSAPTPSTSHAPVSTIPPWVSTIPPHCQLYPVECPEACDRPGRSCPSVSLTSTRGYSPSCTLLGNRDTRLLAADVAHDCRTRVQKFETRNIFLCYIQRYPTARRAWQPTLLDSDPVHSSAAVPLCR